jgi:hypothetical protein
VSDNGIYLHGFDRHGEIMGQSGPYSADQETAIAQDRASWKRMGARHVVQVEAHDPQAAASLAKQVPHTADTQVERSSVADRVARIGAVVGMKAGTTVAAVRLRRSGRGGPAKR